MCCTRLAGNAGPKIAISAPLDTIAQLCRAISSQLTHASINNGKNVVKQQYLLQMSSQYGELRPTNGWDRVFSFEYLCKFQRVSRLGSVTARHSSSGRQLNFAALNRGRHLYSAGRPSRWALAHILVQYLRPNSETFVTFCKILQNVTKGSELSNILEDSSKYRPIRTYNCTIG